MGAPRRGRGGGVRRWHVAFALLATFAFVLSPIAPARADPGDEQRLAQLAREKQELERAVQTSRQNAERYRQEANRFQAAVDAANARIADLAEQQANAETEADALKLDIQISEEQLSIVAFQLSETQALIGSLEAQISEQDKQLGRRKDLYAAHLRTAYLQSRISPLEMLLSSTSLTAFADRVQAMVLVSRQDQQLVDDIRAIKSATADRQAQVTEKKAEIVALQQQIVGQKASLEKKKAQYDTIIEDMKASISTQADLRTQAAVSRNGATNAQQQANYETAVLNKRLEQTEAAYAQLAALLASRSGLAVFTGRMAIWPVNGPITSPFGPRWGGFHNGIDIAAPMFTPVRAAAAGQVVTVGKPYLAYGDTATVVIIAHGSNFSTLYGHLNDDRPPTVRPGQFVTAGTIIAYIGMTGWTTGPHLHFMTIVNGRAVDPMPYMP